MTRTPIADLETVDFARKIIAARRIRNRGLEEIDFADPAWDMLLDLFVTMETGRRLSVLSLALATTTPKSTALEAISRLVVQGHLTREADPEDGRRFYVWLSPALHQDLNRTLAAMRALCTVTAPS